MVGQTRREFILIYFMVDYKQDIIKDWWNMYLRKTGSWTLPMCVVFFEENHKFILWRGDIAGSQSELQWKRKLIKPK